MADDEHNDSGEALAGARGRSAAAVYLRELALTAPRVCPHCSGRHDRVCRHPDGSVDHTPWTQAERDAWRERARQADPTLRFAPSAAQMQDRFGARNARDRARHA